MTCSNCTSGVQRAISSLNKLYTTSPVLSVEVSLVLNQATVVLALPADGDDAEIDVVEGVVYEGEDKESQSLLGGGKQGKKVSVGEGEVLYPPSCFPILNHHRAPHIADIPYACRRHRGGGGCRF